jgi:uncharacterized protein (DUF2141 family)
VHWVYPMMAWLLWAVCAAVADVNPNSLARLNVRVTELPSAGGEVAIAVFDSPETYEARSDAVAKAFVAVAGSEAIWTADLPADRRYVVIAYQDRNGNRELDMRLLGIPKEPVGVSNNVRGRFGPPSFAAASFLLRRPDTSISIAMQ